MLILETMTIINYEYIVLEQHTLNSTAHIVGKRIMRNNESTYNIILKYKFWSHKLGLE